MPHLVTTTSGTVYLIDRKKRTWQRVSKTEQSGHIRNEGSVFYDCKYAVGCPLEIIGEGISFGMRYICTSPVTHIKEVEAD
jgi:hypothetical protein